MNAEKTYDAVVLGAGPAGEVIAGRLADGGMSVAIVERELIGGECSYWACMPSKALLRPAAVLAEAQRIPGVPVGEDAELDSDAILRRRDVVVHDHDDSGQLPWLEDRGIELFRGEGRLSGERRVSVGETTLVAEKAVIVATGSGAERPPIEGLDEVAAWNNREGTAAEAVPQSLLVLGGGPVGCELAQAWASLGAKVTLIHSGEHLLEREEPFAGAEVAAALGERFGVDVRTAASVVKLAATDEGVRAELGSGGTIEAQHLLLATGRAPRSAEIGLEELGVETDEAGFLQTDSRLRVGGREWLYAIGDVNGRALFTHVGKYQAWVAAEHLLGRQAELASEAIGPPRVTFTDPQVAAVGKTLAEAEADGIEARAVDVSTDGNAGASFQGKETGGTSRLVIDTERGTIVGATFTGFETADFLHAATIAIVGEVPVARLRHAVAVFPSRSEIWLKLLEKYEA